MKLESLTGRIPGKVEIYGNAAVDVTSLCVDSRQARSGALFFCTPGLRMDAHDFDPQALELGAVALVVERRLPLDCPQVLVESVRAAVSYIAAEFYGRPADRLKLIGLTGTKGKTTTSFLVKSILEHAGFKVIFLKDCVFEIYEFTQIIMARKYTIIMTKKTMKPTQLFS